jgi:hypothetical protein
MCPIVTTPGGGSNDEYPTFYAITDLLRDRPGKAPTAAPVAAGRESSR